MSDGGRRPLKIRDTVWARRTAAWLAAKGVTPNAISQAAVGFAALGGAGFWLSGATEGWVRALCLILAAAGCQLRLLCNLFDGMVAIEGGRKAPDGPFWNEAPDRAADILILAGAGLGAGAAGLGWAAAALAVATAYVRELGRAEGLGSDYGGPMAKQHRMAVMTGAAVVAILLPGWPVLAWALWLVIAGAALTVALRSRRLVAALRGRG
jgi:phosphatidylglycerophosphate synthase